MKIADVILKKINKDFLLPSIQREFVWLNNPEEQKIEKLFDSILQGYPFGVILTWEVDKMIDATALNWEIYNFVQDYDKDLPHNTLANINGYNKLNLILDGQQRLSALNIGLKGSFSYKKYKNKKQYKEKLFLNLFSNIENELDNNYGFKYEFRFLEKAPDNSCDLWFEVGKVLDFYDQNTELFKEHYDKWIRENSDDFQKIMKAKMILGQLHKAICTDDILTIVPFSSNDEEKILNIFVRTNDGGTKLEKADLLLSYMEANKGIFKGHGARKEIHNFVDSLNKEELQKPNYGIQKDDVLKTALVLSNLEVQYKLKNFNHDNLEIISNTWNDIKKYLTMAIKLVARYGFSSKNILSKNALIPIAYYLYKWEKGNDFVYSQNKNDLELKNEIIKWLSISQLTGAFGGASDTTLKSIRDSINKGLHFSEINKMGKNIDEETVEKWIGNAYYKSKYSHLLLLLITKNKYWDDCHQDHIFPQSKFKSDELRKYKIQNTTFYSDNMDSIANLHLLNPIVNIVKGDDDFIEWGNLQNEEFLKNSSIPEMENYGFENFPDFIEKRKKLIIKEIIKALK